MTEIDPSSLSNSAVLAGGRFFTGNASAKAREKERAGRAGKSFFSGILRKKEAEETPELDEIAESIADLSREEAIGVLLSGVREAGRDLKDRPFPEEIKRYKKRVRAFMQFVVKNTYDVDASVNRLKQRKRVQITVVDQKLERMAAEILTGQLAQLNLLARIEEINGLLVDMLK
jgi:uncharacterized protein YaaR (DUF327 family)